MLDEVHDDIDGKKGVWSEVPFAVVNVLNDFGQGLFSLDKLKSLGLNVPISDRLYKKLVEIRDKLNDEASEESMHRWSIIKSKKHGSAGVAGQMDTAFSHRRDAGAAHTEFFNERKVLSSHVSMQDINHNGPPQWMEKIGDQNVLQDLHDRHVKVSVVTKDDDTNFDTTLATHNKKNKTKTKRASDKIHRHKAIRKFFKYPGKNAKVFRQKFNEDSRIKKQGLNFTVEVYSKWGKKASTYLSHLVNCLLLLMTFSGTGEFCNVSI